MSQPPCTHEALCPVEAGLKAGESPPPRGWFCCLCVRGRKVLAKGYSSTFGTGIVARSAEKGLRK